MNTNGLDDSAKLIILENTVEAYHREKNACKDTCKRFGERIGDLESEDAVKTEQISTFHKVLEKIEAKVDSLTWRVAIITGIGFGANFLLMYLKKG